MCIGKKIIFTEHKIFLQNTLGIIELITLAVINVYQWNTLSNRHIEADILKT